METLLIVISVILIVLVLLQSNKASDSSQIITGGNAIWIRFCIYTSFIYIINIKSS